MSLTGTRLVSSHSRQGDETVTKEYVVVIMIAVVAIATASYLILQPAREEEGPAQPPATRTLEDNIAAALADNQNVVEEEISIQFYSPTENEGIVAVGAVIENSGSNLFLYDSDSQEITIMQVDSEAENSEMATVWGICAQKISEWTGNKLVPWGFSKVENVNVYDFIYSDGFITEWSKWSSGTATIYMDNQEIEWGFFF